MKSLEKKDKPTDLSDNETVISKEEMQKLKGSSNPEVIKPLKHTWNIQKSLFVILEKARTLGAKDIKKRKKGRTMKEYTARMLGFDPEKPLRALYLPFSKAKRIYVPPSGKKKGYWREDPREKHEELLSLLKNLLRKIIGLKKQGTFTSEQRKYVHRKLREIEPRLKHFKTQGQRMAVARVMKKIRMELEEKVREAEKHERLRPVFRTRKGEQIPFEMREGLIELGYDKKDVGKMSLHEARTVYWNKVRKE